MTEMRLEGVTFDYPDGTRALDEVDLLIEAGHVAGAGRRQRQWQDDAGTRISTACCARARVASCSTVRTRPTCAWPSWLAALGLCFQQPDRQIFGRTVRDEVEFGPRHAGSETELAFARAKEALARVGMADELGTHPDDLGETRRKLLTMASVLAMDTAVVVLDEPTTGLDARGVESVSDLVAELVAEGRTVVGISHDMRFVAGAFERVAVLDHGRITLQGSPVEVFAESAWPTLRRAGLEPTAAAMTGARLGLGSTPTEASLVEALRRER